MNEKSVNVPGNVYLAWGKECLPLTPHGRYSFLGKTRTYSPRSRRTLRRIILCAGQCGLDVAVEHDGGLLHRLTLVTVTGPEKGVARFVRHMRRVIPRVGYQPWNRTAPCNEMRNADGVTP
ncbi:hypothetical protein SAMN05421505_12015 [Sinosporangium album]|uniref:Uncharacterized protein n=1 Tax=Sinosporangium album TaxID=504805 RepID=A0A1G8EAU6_9ACTN|nr:hypothetical protein [Sinosporangium album]SDH66981.1 hypothetical protein SAMN05421505_12015 [Sinosporangium album]